MPSLSAEKWRAFVCNKTVVFYANIFTNQNSSKFTTELKKIEEVYSNFQAQLICKLNIVRHIGS